MNVRGTTRLFVAAFAMVALFGGNASAQIDLTPYTPVLSASAVGNIVTIAWTSLPGAQGYDLSVGNTPGSGNITQLRFPASAGTSFSVPAPTGTYNLRVRGFLGPIEGPFSNEESVHPGLEPCVPGTTTTVTATPDGNNANVNWTPVPGVSAYRVQWSRFSGSTELEETVATNSVARPCHSTATSSSASSR